MPRYLFQVSYTSDGAKGVLKEGGSARRDAARTAIESVGGTMETFDYAFGPVDVYLIASFPDHASAAVVPLTVAAAGGATAQTTVLIDPEEIDRAAQKSSDYRPPGG